MSLPTLYNYTKKLLFVAAALTIALGANFAYGQWTDPSSTPPNPNVPAPINVGGDYQIKSGDLGATRVRSDQYCDASGANCVTLGSGGGGGAVSGGGGSLVSGNFVTETLEEVDIRNMVINDAQVKADIGSGVAANAWHTTRIFSDIVYRPDGCWLFICFPEIIDEKGTDNRQAVCDMWAEKRGYTGGTAEFIDFSRTAMHTASAGRVLMYNAVTDTWSSADNAEEIDEYGNNYPGHRHKLVDITCRYI